MSEIIQITDYDVDTLNKLLEQYKNSPNLKSIIESGNTSANDIEEALFEIRDEYYLTTAVGVQLDVLGIIWNVAREGLNDADYRLKITARVAVTNSGEPESIIAILKILFGATFVTYQPFYPAGYNIFTDGSLSITQLETLSPSGVQPYLLQKIYDANRDFLADANGNVICCVAPPLPTFDLVFENGNQVALENGDTLFVA